MHNPPLNGLRSKIDKIDQKIISLLAERQLLILEIGKIKSLNGIKIRDSQREKAALEERCQMGEKNNLEKHQIKKLFRIIFKYSVAAQKKISGTPAVFDKNRHK